MTIFSSTIFLLSLSLMCPCHAWELSDQGITMKDLNPDPERELLNLFSKIKWRRKLKACRDKVGYSPLPFDQWKGQIDSLNEGPTKDNLETLLNITENLTFDSISVKMLEIPSKSQVRKDLVTLSKLRDKAKSIQYSASEGTSSVSAVATDMLGVANAASVVVDSLIAQASAPILAPLQLILVVIGLSMMVSASQLAKLLDPIFPGDQAAALQAIFVLMFPIIFPFLLVYLVLLRACSANPNLCYCEGIFVVFGCGATDNPQRNNGMQLIDDYLQCEFEGFLRQFIPTAITLENEISQLNISATNTSP